ncbi:MAG TPA: glycosyltransferase family 39 protein [bacterium]|nr:glycosyltransferase family 39 protein [bacterium]
MGLRFTTRRAVLGLLCLALLVRLGFMIGAVGFHGAVRGDEINYQDHAANLAAGKGFVDADGRPTAARPPLLPVVLAGLYRLFGTRVEVGRLFQVLVGVAVVGLTYLVAARLFSAEIGLVAAALVAINPYLVFISSYLLTENLYTVLLLATVFAIARDGGLQSAGIWTWVVAGCLIGLASLTRPNAVFLAVLVAPAMLFWGRGTALSRLVKVGALALAIAVTIAPWAVRNHAKLGSWVLFTTHGGITFYQSNNRLVCDDPALYGSVAPRESLPGWEAIHSAKELEGDKLAWSYARAFLRENPRLVPKLAAEKMLRFWRLRSHAPWSGVKSGWWWNKSLVLGNLASRFDFGIVYASVVFPFALVGLVVTGRAYRELYVLYAVIAVHVLVALAFYGSLRARIPIEPVIAAFASVGAARVYFMVRRARSGRSGSDARRLEVGCS